MQPRRSRQAVASAAHSCLCRSAIALAAESALLPATRRAGLREAWSSSARPAGATTFAPAPAVSVRAREGRLPATVPCGTASALVTGGTEHSCEPINGALVEDELIAEAMWAGLDLASRGLSEQVVDPGRRILTISGLAGIVALVARPGVLQLNIDPGLGQLRAIALVMFSCAVTA